MKDYIFTQNRELLLSLLSQHQDIGIVVSDNHNFDNVGAALALYLSFVASSKNVQIISKKQPIVEISHLVGIDKIRQSFEGKLDTLTVSIPRRGKAIQKVSYNIEGDFVNLNIIAGEEGLNFSEDEVRFIKKGTAPALIFTINVSYLSDLAPLFAVDGGVRIVNIDNDSANQMYGDVVLFDPSFSSVSEVVARLIKELTLPMDIDIAQNLMDGIVFATSNFASSNTDAYAFEAASFLMRSGAVRAYNHEEEVKRPNAQPFESPLTNQMNVKSFRQTPVLRNPMASREDTSPPAAMGLDENRTSVPNDWLTPKIYKTGKQDQQ